MPERLWPSSPSDDVRVVERLKPFKAFRMLRFDPTGQLLAAWGGARDDVRIYGFRDGRVALRCVLAGSGSADEPSVLFMAFHPREPLLALAGQKRLISVWDVQRGVRVAEFGSLEAKDPMLERGHWGLAFSPCGRFVDTHSFGFQRGERYDWRAGELLGTFWGAGGPLAWHPEGELFADCGVGDVGATTLFGQWAGQSVEWFDVAVGSFFPVTNVCFSPDGCALGLLGGSGRLHLQVHEFPSCRLRFARELDLTPDEVEFPFGVSEALTFARDATSLFGPSCSGEVVEWSARDGSEVRRWRAHDGMVMTVASHPREPFVVSGGADGVLSIARESGSRSPVSARPGSTAEFRQKFDRCPDPPPPTWDPPLFEP